MILEVLVLLATLMIGMNLGKWLTDRIWMNDAKHPFRINRGGRLWQVKDVSPWK